MSIIMNINMDNVNSNEHKDYLTVFCAVFCSVTPIIPVYSAAMIM